MPYAIEYLGLRGTCNTPEEFIRLAKYLQACEPQEAYTGINDALSHVNETGHLLFAALLEADAPMPVSLLKKQLGISGNQLPGHITALKKKLRAGGSDPDQILIKHVNGGEDRYSLSPDFLADIRAALESKNGKKVN